MADEPVVARRLSGDLITVLRELQALVVLPAQAHPVADSVLRERTDYPPPAIRELLLNAMATGPCEIGDLIIELTRSGRRASIGACCAGT